MSGYLGEPDFVEKFAELLFALKTELDVPIFPKLNVNLPTLLMVNIFKKAGVNYISLLNSISLPAPISIDNNGLPMLRFSSNINRASLFGAWQFPLTLKYLYDFKIEGFSVCAGGGIQSSKDIIELIFLGASAIQVATSIILNGYHVVSEYIKDIKDYMLRNNIESVSSFQGITLPHLRGSVHYDKAKVQFNESCCIKCNKCTEQAFCAAISKNYDKVVITESLCDGCSLCVDLCPSKALHLEAV